MVYRDDRNEDVEICASILRASSQVSHHEDVNGHFPRGEISHSLRLQGYVSRTQLLALSKGTWIFDRSSLAVRT